MTQREPEPSNRQIQPDAHEQTEADDIFSLDSHRDCVPPLTPTQLERVAALFAKTAVMLDTPDPLRSKARTMRSIGEWVREQRKIRGVSRAELAQRTNLDARFLLNLESGILMPEGIVAYILNRIVKQIGCEHTQIPEDLANIHELEFNVFGMDT